jgi:hypothetical protein
VTKSGAYVTYSRYDLEDNLVSFEEAKNIIMELIYVSMEVKMLVQLTLFEYLEKNLVGSF